LLTPRGWWFLVILLLLGGVGVRLSVQAGDAIAVFALTLLAWFLWEWAQFAYRYYLVLPRLRLHRELSDERKVVPILWAGGEFDVRVRITLEGSGDLPYVVLADWIPTDGKRVEGSEEVIVALSGERPAEIAYRLKCPVPGELRFEGVRVRIADRQGFFYHRTLIRDGSSYPVLPRLTGAEGQRRGSKKINIFPPPGVHRLKRPGGGSELLDLRDYIPGDPPKMIAWKPSARRDKLFTKEFESEVPVRCTLFVDASEGTRLGEKRTKITRLVNLAAGVAEAAVADRDHAGLVVFDEHDSQVMRPKRSRRHVIDMLHLLARAASRPTPIGPFADASALAKLAFPMANELYPDLMHKRVNTRPFRMFWAPSSDYRSLLGMTAFIVFLAVPCAIPAFIYFGFPLLVFFFAIFHYYTIPPFLTFVPHVATFGFIANSFVARWFGIPGVIVATLLTISGSVLLAAAPWLAYGLTGLMEPWRSERLRRKQLGLLFATLDADKAGAESHYMHDDQVFARRAQGFLAEHHARYPVRLYDARGRYLFHGRPKLDVLVKALNYSVARGRDNELFVLLVDLIDLVDDLDPLIRAVRVAVARHHQVMVILPWQDDIPDPPKEAPDEGRIPLRKAERFALEGFKAIVDELTRDFIDHYHRAYFKLRREFGRLGVVVVRADQEEPVQIVLDRIDRLRGVGRRR
jgi:uncharacterized protein (DUF58 family)